MVSSPQLKTLEQKKEKKRDYHSNCLLYYFMIELKGFVCLAAFDDGDIDKYNASAEQALCK